MRRMLWVTVIMLSVVVVAFLQHRVLLERFFTQGENAGPGGHAWYVPTEEVPGAHQGFLPVAPSDRQSISPEALQAARAYARINRSESLLIWHAGSLQLAEYWMGTDPTTLVNSRSMHKMLAGLLVGRAVQQNHIDSLDSPIADHVPHWQASSQARIRVRHVLTMASGLQWFGSGRDLFGIPNPFGTATRRYLDPNWDQILLHKVTMSFTPGDHYDYSDITADVIPHLIEGATGRRYAEYLGEALLQPLGALGGKIWISRPGGLPHGGCCLLLPPETWLRIGILVLQKGRWEGQQILPEWWYDEMTTPSPTNPNFGLMLWLGEPYHERRLYHRPDSPSNQTAKPGVYQSAPFLASDLIMFDGFEGRLVYIVPSAQLVIVRTGFRPLPGNPEWDNALLPNTILRGLVPA